MKKLVTWILCAMMLATMFFTTAFAACNLIDRAFGFTAYTDGSTLTNANDFHVKEGDNCNIIEVRHRVIGDGSTGGYTNCMYAYSEEFTRYSGAKWQAPDGIYHSCTSSFLIATDRLTPGGRGNTKYQEFLGLSRVRLEGQFRSH